MASLKGDRSCFSIYKELWELKALIQPAYYALVISWLACVVTIFMVHEIGHNKGQVRDGTSKASWLNKSP